MIAQLSAEDIVAKAADHADGVTEPGDRDGLIGAFSAGMHGEVLAEQSLAGQGGARRSGNEIDVDAAYDDDWLDSGQRRLLIQKTGDSAMAVRPQRKKMNIQVRSVFERLGAPANSLQTKTPHAAEIMVAPWPME